MKSTPNHLAWDDLPQEQKFERLAPSRKRLTDTVKLVAYRAETALATIVREELSHVDEARCLIRDLFRSDADLQPDEAAGVLEVRLHTLANPRSNRAIQHLLDHLNAAEFTYPGTHLRLTYTLAAPPPNDSDGPILVSAEIRSSERGVLMAKAGCADATLDAPFLPEIGGHRQKTLQELQVRQLGFGSGRQDLVELLSDQGDVECRQMLEDPCLECLVVRLLRCHRDRSFRQTGDIDIRHSREVRSNWSRSTCA